MRSSLSAARRRLPRTLTSASRPCTTCTTPSRPRGPTATRSPGAGRVASALPPAPVAPAGAWWVMSARRRSATLSSASPGLGARGACVSGRQGRRQTPRCPAPSARRALPPAASGRRRWRRSRGVPHGGAPRAAPRGAAGTALRAPARPRRGCAGAPPSRRSARARALRAAARARAGAALDRPWPGARPAGFSRTDRYWRAVSMMVGAKPRRAAISKASSGRASRRPG